MTQPHYAIMRFAKYKGPEITNIEAHNERRKENYASNPDIDQSRSKYNFHLVEPSGKYRTEAERQISAANCRTRKDSIRVVEVMFTATHNFFQGKSKAEIRAFFTEALHFLEQHQAKETILSAVVHMDDLSAKDIVGNKKKLTWWQDQFWEHMVQKYPDLERGESASLTGRDHIPPRIFKEMTKLNKQRQKLDDLLSDIGPFNGKKRAAEISKLLDGYIPAVEKMHTQLKKYNVAFTETVTENKRLKKKTTELKQSLEAATKTSVLKELRDVQLRRDYEDAMALLERIPPEVLDEFRKPKAARREAGRD